jgi:hypothetical protein
MELTKEEIQILIQIVENVSLPVKQTQEIVVPLLSKLKKMLDEESNFKTS